MDIVRKDSDSTMAEVIVDDYKMYINFFLIRILSFLTTIWKLVKRNKREKDNYNQHRITLNDIRTNESSHIPLWFTNEDTVQIKASKGLTIKTSFIFIITNPKEMIIKRGVSAGECKYEPTQSKDNENDASNSCDFQRQRNYCGCKNKNGNTVQTNRLESKKTSFCDKCRKCIYYSEINNMELGDIDHNSRVIDCDAYRKIEISKPVLMSLLKRKRPLYPKMQNINQRMISFKINFNKWYFMQFTTQWKCQAFADAGFFLTEDGQLLCYVCGLCIRHENEDFPLCFHKEWSPGCEAVLNRNFRKETEDKIIDTNF